MRGGAAPPPGAASTAAGRARIVTGSYTGNGSSKTVSLGFAPKALWVRGGVYETMVTNYGGHDMLSLTASGFTARYDSSQDDHCPNIPNASYSYAAIQ